MKAGAWLGIPVGPLLAGVAVEGAGPRAALLLGAAVFRAAATLPPFIFSVFNGDGSTNTVDHNLTEPRALPPVTREDFG